MSIDQQDPHQYQLQLDNKVSHYRLSKIILTQGLNRQIRRMCDFLDYQVVSLKRVRIMNIKLKKLPIGAWRELTEKEFKYLNESLQKNQL